MDLSFTIQWSILSKIRSSYRPYFVADGKRNACNFFRQVHLDNDSTTEEYIYGKYYTKDNPRLQFPTAAVSLTIWIA
jgi:hypothetical protein